MIGRNRRRAEAIAHYAHVLEDSLVDVLKLVTTELDHAPANRWGDYVTTREGQLALDRLQHAVMRGEPVGTASEARR